MHGGKKGEATSGNLGKVDKGDMAGMPTDSKPASSSPREHHPYSRQGILFTNLLPQQDFLTPVQMSLPVLFLPLPQSSSLRCDRPGTHLLASWGATKTNKTQNKTCVSLGFCGLSESVSLCLHPMVTALGYHHLVTMLTGMDLFCFFWPRGTAQSHTQ